MTQSEWLNLDAVRITHYIWRTLLTLGDKWIKYLKLENKQLTGSFKIRGNLNNALKLEDWERLAGLEIASLGNHRQGLTVSGKLVDTPVIVSTPDVVLTGEVKHQAVVLISGRSIQPEFYE